MTEKQLRESLHEYLSPAGLPERRRQDLLRQIRSENAPACEKGEPHMFRPHKFRTAMIAAAVVTLLTFTVALAAGFTGYVNFKGEPVDNIPMAEPTPMPSAEPELPVVNDDTFTDILNREMNTAWGYLVDITYEDADGNGKGGSRNVLITADTPDEMAALVNGALPLPAIPEGYAFKHGHVSFACDGDSSYELAHEEITPEGVCIRYYAIPEGEAVALEYSLVLENAEGERIHCWANLGFSNSSHRFGVSEEDVVQTPAVPGMDDALLILRPDSTRLALRRMLDEPVLLWSSHTSSWERWPVDTYTTLEISVDSDTAPADVLLSMFAE